jgi:4-diphosphocytidyl-2-C-methyl-D-erythritol kinase
MVVFPNAKINLGLEILRKRNDGYHDIDSVFFPIPLCDVLELVPDPQLKKDAWHFTGLRIPGSTTDNLCAQALDLLRESYDIPALKIFLHKIIPMGAGLGGGSSDATFFIKAANELFQLNLSIEEMEKVALSLGSDCPFFVKNKSARATGRGELLEPIEMDLKGKYLVLIYPGIHVSTKEAYAKIEVDDTYTSPADVVKKPLMEWRENLRNRFEEYAFDRHTELAEIKNILYKSGALYTSMTGSGSAIFGIFGKEMEKQNFTKFGYVFTAQL